MSGLELLERVRQIAFAGIREAEIEVNGAELRRQFECSLVLLDGRVHLACVGQSGAEIDTRGQRGGTHRKHCLVVANRVGEIALLLLFDSAV